MGGESYGAFAYAYDQALGRRFFRAVQRLLVTSLEERPSVEKTHLDLACGARDAPSARRLRTPCTRGRRLHGPASCALPRRRTFARITCLYDSLNHLME